MSKKQKLELTWVGKDEQPLLEPRILIEDPEKSYGDKSSKNMLIKGDNLLALKALEQKFTNKIKCIYIDPPYNTGARINADGEAVGYEDGLEHSEWLRMMQPRLQLLKKLLTDDGFIAIQIDDNEFARLYLLMTEIFGENNLKTICVKMSEASGLKMGSVKKHGSIPKLKEFIIIAKKNGIRDLTIDLIPKGNWDSEYNIFLDNFELVDKKKIDEINGKETITEDDISSLDAIAQKVSLSSLASKLKDLEIKKQEDKDKWCFENAYRICQCVTSASVLKLAEQKKIISKEPLFFVLSNKGEIAYFVRATYSEDSKKPRLQLIFAEDNLAQHPGDLWTDIKTTGLDNEGSVNFKNGKKPEDLVYRIIKMNTEPGDFVLDSFLGSGTTAAVALKMNRKFIGIEMGQHCDTHCLQRLKRVVDGTDQGGISRKVDWKGGDGFKYYNLAPSLLKKDHRDNWIINPEYNAEMLAAAMAKHEGFTYSPSSKFYWKQGSSTESDYIFVTTQSVTVQLLDQIHSEMGENESLLICCRAYSKSCVDKYQNISIKKIPKMIQSRCEFGIEDYSLHIIDSPLDELRAEVEIETEEVEIESNNKNKSNQVSLFK